VLLLLGLEGQAGGSWCSSSRGVEVLVVGLSFVFKEVGCCVVARSSPFPIARMIEWGERHELLPQFRASFVASATNSNPLDRIQPNSRFLCEKIPISPFSRSIVAGKRERK
jgi:hypothetical protein